MSHLCRTVLTIALATAAVGAGAQTAAQVDAQHKQHQALVLATEQASAAPVAPDTTPASAGKMAAMDSEMKSMDEMHQKMMAAKTPEEKKALMAEHMQTMQAGMTAMSKMGGVGMADMQGKKPMSDHMDEHHKMIEKRMAMMESMMQMMMDRMSAPAAN
jgi:hypothetical protein